MDRDTIFIGVTEAIFNLSRLRREAHDFSGSREKVSRKRQHEGPL
jgi:hypothetical protein